MRKPYFNPSKVPPSQNEYVAWVDLMGCQSLMGISMKVASSAIFKVHVAALDAKIHLNLQQISLYPVMDGFYATTAESETLKAFLTDVFLRVAKVFLDDKLEHKFQFLIKGAISFGEVVHGKNVGKQAANRLDENPPYRESILIGLPIAQSHLLERSAPPFGFSIHDSAKSAFGLAERDTWWQWFDEQFEAQEFYKELKNYFDWNLDKKGKDGYKIDRIIVHDALAKKYLFDR